MNKVKEEDTFNLHHAIESNNEQLFDTLLRSGHADLSKRLHYIDYGGPDIYLNAYQLLEEKKQSPDKATRQFGEHAVTVVTDINTKALHQSIEYCRYDAFDKLMQSGYVDLSKQITYSNEQGQEFGLNAYECIEQQKQSPYEATREFAEYATNAMSDYKQKNGIATTTPKDDVRASIDAFMSLNPDYSEEEINAFSENPDYNESDKSEEINAFSEAAQRSVTPPIPRDGPETQCWEERVVRLQQNKNLDRT